MKGVFFQKPFEFNLLVEGETWRQGDPIQGTLTIKNRSDQAAPLEGNAVSLGYGSIKKVHANKSEALDILALVPFSASSVPAQGEATFPWKFETERNSPITDTVGSPFLFYGSAGILQLRVSPDPIVEEFFQALQTQFRFVKKSQKSSKTRIVTKLDPPSAQGFRFLEQLIVTTEFEGDTLHVNYAFEMKKLEASPASSQITVSKKGIDQSFGPQDYKIPSGRFNHEKIEASIREALSTVENKIL